MNGSLVRFRPVARRASALASLMLPLAFAPAAPAGPPAAGMVDQGAHDPRLEGIKTPKGFKVRVVADEDQAGASPIAMAFDDRGQLFVVGWTAAERTFETSETLALPGGETARVRKRRKTTTDVVRRLVDKDGDGVFEASEVVLDGAELPSGILPGKNELLLACVGRLERWSDEDGDGRYETRAVLADGFPGADLHGLSGIARGADGWLYLATGDGDAHILGHDGVRADLARAGAIFRCRPDGSRLHPYAIGLADPHGGLAFDSTFDPFVADDDLEDGSKFQGVRLVNPVEDGDYGWRSRPDGSADLDRAAVDGERPGRLPIVAKVGKGTPTGLAVYNGTALPPECRDLLLYPDPARHALRGFKVKPRGGTHSLEAETTLVLGDDAFHPRAAAVGPDGALYLLDARGPAGDAAKPWGEGKPGRIYRITYEGDGTAPALPTKPNDWKRVASANKDQLIALMSGGDEGEADRAQREFLARDQAEARTLMLAFLGNPGFALHTRLLGLQGARQLWDDAVEAAMLQAIGDDQPDVRRLAVQALAWEPKAALPRILPRLYPLLADADGRVAREAALAIGRHAEGRPGPAAVFLVRRLFADPDMDPTVRDGYVRALERLGDAGVEEVALAVRTKKGADRGRAITLFSALRSPAAADRLPGLVLIPDLDGPERLALVRHFRDISATIPVPTQGLADWVVRHPDVEPPVKVATLEVCRLAGNPASALVLHLLDDEVESTRLAAIEAAGRSRPPGAMAKLAARLKEPDRSAAERLAIVRALRNAGPSAFAALEAAHARSTDDPAYPRAALRALAASDPTKAQPAVEAALKSTDPELHAEAILVLGSSPKGAASLAKALLAKTIGRDDLPAVLAALRKHRDDADARSALADVEKAAASGPLAFAPADLKARVGKGGDPWKGLEVFFRDRSGRCASCHKVESLGGEVGPALAEASRPAIEANALLAAILEPSKEIREGFETLGLKLKGGKETRGIEVGGDAESIILRDASGKDRSFPLDRVEDQARSSSSLMPANLLAEMTAGEVADLAAFLRSTPARESLRHGPRRFDRVLAIGPMEPGADKLRLPLKRVDPAQTLPGQDEVSARWEPLEASGAGTFDLRGQFGNRPGRAYVAAEVRTEEDQEAALRFAVEGAARVYLNGTKVADLAEMPSSEVGPAFAPTRPPHLAPMPGLARLPLKAGWNLVIVALDRSADGHALAAFEVASPEPVEVRTPRGPESPNDTAATPSPGRNR